MPGAFQFSLLRKGWYICHSIFKSYHRVPIVADYNEPSSKWMRRCSFVLRPLGGNENARMNCLDLFVQTSTIAPKTISTTKSNPPKITSTLPHKPEGKKICMYNRPIHVQYRDIMRFTVLHNRHHEVSQSVPFFMHRKTVTILSRISVRGHFVMSITKNHESYYVTTLLKPVSVSVRPYNVKTAAHGYLTSTRVIWLCSFVLLF